MPIRRYDAANRATPSPHDGEPIPQNSFPILIFCSPALFVKLTSGSPMKRSKYSSCFARHSCRLCAADFAMRPRVPFGLGQCFGGAPVDAVAGLVQQPFHQACPTEAVGLEEEGQFPEQVAAAQLMPALVVGEVRRPAVMDQRAGVTRDDADLVDRLLAAQGCAVHRRHRTASTARHSPGGIFLEPSAPRAALRLMRCRSVRSHPASPAQCIRSGAKLNQTASVRT